MIKLLALLLVGWLAWASAPAAAAPNNAAAAEKTAAAAKAAYDAANFEEAARLYLQAWQLLPAQGGWLYSSARACHKAGHLDDAAERYREFLSNPKGAEDKVAQATQHLADVQHERVKVLLRRAVDAPDPALGYRHAAAAAKILPDDVHVWMTLAELADKAGMTNEAIEAYQRVQKLAPANSVEAQAAARRLAALAGTPLPDPEAQKRQAEEAERARQQAAARLAEAEQEERRQAEKQQAEKQQAEKQQAEKQQRDAAQRAREAADRERLEQVRRAASPKPAATDDIEPPKIATAKADASSAWPPGLTLAAGVLLGAAGGWQLAVAAGEEKALHDKTWGALTADPNSVIPMGYLDAQAQANAIGNRKLLGAALASTGGAVAVAAAIWWAVRPGDKPSIGTLTLAPANDGAVATWIGGW